MRRILLVAFGVVATLNASEGGASQLAAFRSGGDSRYNWSISLDELQESLDTRRTTVPSLKELTVQKVVDEVGICGFDEFLKKLEGIEKESEVRTDSLKVEESALDPALKCVAAKRWYKNAYDWVMQKGLSAQGLPANIIEIFQSPLSSFFDYEDGDGNCRPFDDLPICRWIRQPITGISYLPYGNILISYGCVLKLWNQNTCQVIKSFNVQGTISSLLTLPNGNIVTSTDREVVSALNPITNFVEWGLQYKYKGMGSPKLSLLPNGNLVVAHNGNVEIRDSNTGELIKIFSTGFVNMLSVLQNGDIATCRNFNEVNIWNSDTGDSKLGFKCNYSFSKPMLIEINGKLAVSRFQSIEIRDLNNGNRIKKIVFEKEVFCLALLLNGYIIVSVGDGEVVIVDPESGDVKNKLKIADEVIQTMTTLPNGNIVTGSSGGQVKLWKIRETIIGDRSAGTVGLNEICDMSNSLEEVDRKRKSADVLNEPNKREHAELP